jgi:hypothetical protein
MIRWVIGGATAAILASSSGLLAADKKEVKPYPLDTCVVSDEKLGSMGEPFVLTEKGQEVKLCCKSCQKDFKKDKDKYLKKIDAAAAKKKAAK